uniref:Uncharacterized protein n=2 Tax=Picea TaxID=3328 RepID=A0A117NHT8_PICGL|nr:hypothetical protein ABT39_MTgene4241 [Picea glauca]QHR91755.1 hypothetical protein Q903MT_gene5791 [Picea sitchensis]
MQGARPYISYINNYMCFSVVVPHRTDHFTRAILYYLYNEAHSYICQLRSCSLWVGLRRLPPDSSSTIWMDTSCSLHNDIAAPAYLNSSIRRRTL